MPSPFRVPNSTVTKNTPTRAVSDLQETAVAKATGGKKTVSSGSTMFGGKGDVVIKLDNHEDWLLECKTKMTPSKSISIKKEWIQKNIQEMIANNNKHQAIVINFGPNEDNYYIITEADFKLFLELLGQLNN